MKSGEWEAGERLPTDGEIARDLGVHYHTVRLALASLAKEGYLVRHRGRGTFVAERRVKQHLGILFGSDVRQFSASCFNTLFARYAQDYLHDHGSATKVYLVQRWLREKQGLYSEDFARDIQEGGLRGCLVVGGAQFDVADHFDLLLRRSIPFVIGTYVSTNYPSVGFDVESLVNQGMEHLVARGYRRIAIVYGYFPDAPVMPKDLVFYRGYQSALAKLGLEQRPEWIKAEREPSEEAGYLAMKELWALGANRPDAILSCDDVMTKGIIHAWWELGVQVPRDLGFVTHCNKDVPILYPVPLTRLECDVGELVRLAGDMLLTLLERKPLSQHRVTIKPKLIAGKSCGESLAGDMN
jgi:DNA-binding LacI/PurR family transcriptional regulator